MPKINCDNRAHHAELLRIPFESMGSLRYINFFKISPCHQVSAGSTDPWHHSMTLNQKKVSLGHIPKGNGPLPSLKPYIFLLCRVINVLNKKGGENPRINIPVDWLNVKRLHCRHSKIVKWLNQTEHTLWGSPRRDLQKDRMRLHELSHLSRKRQSICVFHKIEKKKKNQITKIGKNVMNIVQFSIALHYCIQSLHLLHFKMKIA